MLVLFIYVPNSILLQNKAWRFNVKRFFTMVLCIVFLFTLTACRKSYQEELQEAIKDEYQLPDPTTTTKPTNQNNNNTPSQQPETQKNTDSFQISTEKYTYTFELESEKGYKLEPGDNDPGITSIWVGNKRYCAVVIFDDTLKEIKGDMIASGQMELTKRGTQAAYTLYRTQHDDGIARYIVGEFYNTDDWVYFEINDNHYHLNNETDFTRFFNTVDVTRK